MYKYVLTLYIRSIPKCANGPSSQNRYVNQVGLNYTILYYGKCIRDKRPYFTLSELMSCFRFLGERRNRQVIHCT